MTFRNLSFLIGANISKHLQYNTIALPYIMGTATPIGGIYIAEKDQYFTLQEAFEQNLISDGLYVELMERVCASGYYINQHDSKLVMGNGF